MGRVLRVTGHEVRVETVGGVVPCLLRGRFRKKKPSLQVVAGDRVEVSLPDAGSEHGAIEGVEPRQSWLSRFVGGRVSAERIIVANIDRLFLVVSIRDPRLNLRFLDRVLVSGERGGTPVTLVLNKTDLLRDPGEAAVLRTVYGPLGYGLLLASAATGDGVERIADEIRDGVYAFVGQSGVGKSSLLNRIDPALDLKVSNVAQKTGRGRHTTTYSQLFPIRGGYLADTPGMQTFGFPGTDVSELARCFPEFRDREHDCRFQPCTHSHEPGCAVKAGVEAGEIAVTRHRSYLDMRAEVEERERGRY